MSSHAGQQSSASIEHPVTTISAKASAAAVGTEPTDDLSQPTGKSHPHAQSSKSTSKSDAAGVKSPAKASSSSPGQRLPSTPSPANSHPHSPETPVSGQTTANASPAGTPSTALHHQQHHTPRAHTQQRDASAAASNGHNGAVQAVSQQQPQQQQHQQGFAHLPVISFSDVQRDPVVQLASRRSTGRMPPPGFSVPVAAPSSTAAINPQGARNKVCSYLAVYSYRLSLMPDTEDYHHAAYHVLFALVLVDCQHCTTFLQQAHMMLWLSEASCHTHFILSCFSKSACHAPSSGLGCLGTCCVLACLVLRGYLLLGSCHHVLYDNRW